MLAERIETWFEEATRKGLEKGVLQGMERGRMEGEARLLAKLLARRFGPLPQAVVDQLYQASETQLEAWGEAVLSAPSLEAVFDSSRH